MKKAAVLIGILMAVFCSSYAFATEAEAILGKWWTEKKDAHVQIYKCDDKYCGKIVYLRDPTFDQKDTKGMAGKPKVDRENPDPAKRSNPILGMNIVSGFKYAGDNVWKDGIIYNPEDGKTYDCKLTLEKPDRLKVRGFIGVSLLGKTQYWVRVK